MNILILTGKFGMGHWMASQSLRQQLLEGFPQAEVEVVDFPAYAVPNFSDTMYKCFNLVVSHGSHLFNIYYKFTAMGHPDARPPFEGLLLDRLAELLVTRCPDVVIATHPLCAQLVSRFKEKTALKSKAGLKEKTALKSKAGLKEKAALKNKDLLKGKAGHKEEAALDLPLITCVTDVTSHPEWINRNTDCYLVASQEIRASLAEKGVDPALVCVTGIPVREEFRHLSRHSGCQRRELLIMGGGLGLLPREASFYDSLNQIPDVHVTIITGRNHRLYDRLHGRWENIQVIGYTNKVWDYMASADLIVTKPGGITLFEAIFAQVPILSWPPTLQQERNNALWMTGQGIGWVAGEVNCAGEIQEILMDERRLAQASSRMGYLRRQLKAEVLNRLMEVVAREGTGGMVAV